METQEPADEADRELFERFGGLERSLWFSFFPMDAALWQRLSKQLKRDTGLSEPDFQVLVTLLNAGPHALRAHDLAARIDFDKARLHRHLERMQQRGLVERRRDGEDRRGVRVALTARGRDAIIAARPVRGIHIREAMVDALSDDELESFVRACEKILRHLRTLDHR